MILLLRSRPQAAAHAWPLNFERYHLSVHFAQPRVCKKLTCWYSVYKNGKIILRECFIEPKECYAITNLEGCSNLWRASALQVDKEEISLARLLILTFCTTGLLYTQNGPDMIWSQYHSKMNENSIFKVQRASNSPSGRHKWYIDYNSSNNVDYNSSNNVDYNSSNNVDNIPKG